MADTTFVNGHYFSRAWRMMTQDKGWLAPVCILALCLYVPIVGALGVAGYALCWARLTAWGVDAAPKQRGVRVGECIGAGWRAFVVSLGWGLLAGIVALALTWLLDFAGTPGSTLLGLLLAALDIFAGLLVLVANLRACIYQKIGAGFGFSQVWTMFTHDLGGLFHILGIAILGGLVAAIPLAIAVFSMIPPIMSLIWSAYYSYATNTAALIMTSVAGIIQSAVLPLLLAGFITHVISVITMLLVYTAGALWIRQFNVPAWGSPSDPVPLSLGCDPLPAGSYNPYPQPTPQPQQPPVAQPPATSAYPESEPSSPSTPEASPIELVLDSQPQDASGATVQGGTTAEDEVDLESEEEVEDDDEFDGAPEPPVSGMERSVTQQDENEIVTPLIVHKDEEENDESEDSVEP